MKDVLSYLWHCLTMPFRVSYRTWRHVQEMNRIGREVEAALVRNGTTIRGELAPGEECKPGDPVAYNDQGKLYRVKGKGVL
jgi:hypothetical protein